MLKKYVQYFTFSLPISRPRGLQPVHLPPAAGVHRHGPRVDLSAVRQRRLRQGVYRQADEPVQVLRVRVVRQRCVGAGRHPGHARLPDRHEAAQGAAEALQGRLEAVLERK